MTISLIRKSVLSFKYKKVNNSHKASSSVLMKLGQSQGIGGEDKRHNNNESKLGQTEGSC